jgi:hypothetical protein
VTDLDPWYLDHLVCPSEGTPLRLDAGDLVSAGRSLQPVDGHLPVAPMPPAPDPERLRQFQVTDTARVTWWRQRLAAVQHLL